MEVVASLSQGRTAAAQCGLFTHKSVPVIFEPPCISPINLKRPILLCRLQHCKDRTALLLLLLLLQLPPLITQLRYYALFFKCVNTR